MILFINVFYVIIFLSIIFYLTFRHIKNFWNNNIHLPAFVISCKLFFLIFYWQYSGPEGLGTDAFSYFDKNDVLIPWALGNHFLFNIGVILKNFFLFNYFSAIIFTGIISVLSLLWLLEIFSDLKYKKEINLFTIVILFIPSLHFWSSGLSKETFGFAAFCLLANYMYFNNYISIIKIIKVSLFLLLVRPFFIPFIILTIVFYNILYSEINPKKIFIFFVTLFFSIIILQKSLAINTDNQLFFSLKDLANFLDTRRAQNLSGGSSIEISNYNPLELFIRYYFDPSIIFPKINNKFSIIIFFENTLILIILLILIYKILKNKISFSISEKKKITSIVFLLFIFSIASFYINSNMGIIFRYKIHTWPIIILLIFFLYKKIYFIK